MSIVNVPLVPLTVQLCEPLAIGSTTYVHAPARSELVPYNLSSTEIRTGELAAAGWPEKAGVSSLERAAGMLSKESRRLGRGRNT